MSDFTKTLGLGAAPKLVPLRHAIVTVKLNVPVPAERPDLRERVYTAHVLGQLIDTCAEGLAEDSRFMKHIQFENQAKILHNKTDKLVGLLFDGFNNSEADSLNALTAVCQAAIVSIVKLAVGGKHTKYTANRAYELLRELSVIAGVNVT